jgi:hypothetical protein
MAATSLVNERLYYGDTTSELRRLLWSCAQAHPAWTVKLAVFLREELNLRSVSQLVLATAAMVRPARPFVERAFGRVVRRPDDMVEIAALLKDPANGLGRSLPAVIRRCIRRELNALDEYRLLKYRSAGAFGLKHILRLCHPRPASDRQNALFRLLLDRDAWGDLSERARAGLPLVAAWDALNRADESRGPLVARCAETGLPWEMVVSRLGSRREVWSALIPRMPTMALLRNLVNLSATGCLDDETVRRHVRDRFTNRAIIRNSRLFPFRWLAASNAIRNRDPEVATWLSYALEVSADNLPFLPGRTVIACDNSGSMTMPISEHSCMTAKSIAGLLGAAAQRMCERSLVLVFADAVAAVRADPSEGILQRARRIARTDVGQATYAFKVPRVLRRNALAVDRLIVLTDMQTYGRAILDLSVDSFDSALREYRHRVNPHLRTYIVNLVPYEHFMTPADEQGVTYIAGWNEQILRFIARDTGEGDAPLVDYIDGMGL